MKKIRFDYYRYRLKKGRAYILLTKGEGEKDYLLPSHYVWSNERIGHLSFYNIEDDGDLVLNITSLNDSEHGKTAKEWVPIKQIREITLPRNESFHIYHNILRFFLLMCPEAGELGIRRTVEDMLEELRIDMAKKEYVEDLQKALDGRFDLSSFYSAPDPEKLKEEIRTLAHFRLYKPNTICMNQKDWKLKESETFYSYKSIVDWEAMGCKPITIRPFRFSGGCIVDPILDPNHSSETIDELNGENEQKNENNRCR